MNQQDHGEQLDRLQRALATGDDEVFSRGKAAQHLTNHKYRDDAFPFYDEENDRWILDAEAERLDGTVFIGKIVFVSDGHDPCPECGNERRHYYRWTNGVVGGHRRSCTVCDHVFSEQHG